MRYEHIELDISTAACDEILQRLTRDRSNDEWAPKDSAELIQFINNLRARLQRRDADPHCPLNSEPTDEELMS